MKNMIVVVGKVPYRMEAIGPEEADLIAKENGFLDIVGFAEQYDGKRVWLTDEGHVSTARELSWSK